VSWGLFPIILFLPKKGKRILILSVLNKKLLLTEQTKMFLILLYLSITTTTGVLLYLITKYLRRKPFGVQFVADHISIDLAISVFVVVLFTSVTVVAREILGPFSESIANVLLVLQQVTAAELSINILSIQVAQFANVFFSAR
jgi:hypothetical protein